MLIITAAAISACRSGDSAHSSSTGSSAAPPAAPAPPAPAPTTNADPCGYATKEEVGAAIGKPIVLAERVAADRCAYHPDPKPSNALYIRVSDGGAYASMKQIMQDMTPVTGLGDDAMWGQKSSTLHVKAGSKLVTISVMDVRWNNGDSKAAAVATARAVLPRLH